MATSLFGALYNWLKFGNSQELDRIVLPSRGMTEKKSQTPTKPSRPKVDATTGDPEYDISKVDATTGDPAYDLTQTPGGSSGGAPYDPQKPGSGVGRERGGPDPDKKEDPSRPDRTDPPQPVRRDPPIHEPEPPHDPIREPLEGNQDIGKRSDMTPGRN